MVFLEADKPDAGVDTVLNIMCLAPHAHHYWTKAYFGLQRGEVPADKTELPLRFFWLAHGEHSTPIGILAIPKFPLQRPSLMMDDGLVSSPDR